MPTITFDNPNPTYGQPIGFTVVYDPLSIPITATAPNGEQATATVVFTVAVDGDPLNITRVSDDGHTAVFTGTLP